MLRSLLTAAAAALLALGGCGGDDDDGGRSAAPPAAPTTETVPSRPETTAREEEEPAPERSRTPRSLADCLREGRGVSEVLVKGADSEDARFFSELAAGSVSVLGVTVEGVPGEVTVALFESAAAARRAAPNAGGGSDLAITPLGSALVIAPSRADTGAVADCLRATGYAGG